MILPGGCDRGSSDRDDVLGPLRFGAVRVGAGQFGWFR